MYTNLAVCDANIPMITINESEHIMKQKPRAVAGKLIRKQKKDPVVTLWERMEAMEKEADALSDAAYEKVKAFTPEHELIYELYIDCHFPEVDGLGSEPMRRAYDEDGVNAAIWILNTRASHGSKKDQSEAERLGKRWLAELWALEEKAEKIKEGSGYNEMNDKSDEIYMESRKLQKKFFATKAESVEGALLQVKEMYQYIHYGMQNHGEGIMKQLKTLEKGLKNIVSKSA